jgi:hypothetical protein
VALWPPIEEPQLLERLRMGNEEFAAAIRALVREIPPRSFDRDVYEHALGYPWERPSGSFHLGPDGARSLREMPAPERERLIARLTAAESGRVPLLAFGSNGSPGVLERKFAHFLDEGDRTVLVLAGWLHDFDVAAAAQPAVYGALPATLIPSSGTEVRGAVLWVTPAQFTQLTWSELSYRLGSLRTAFETDEGSHRFEELLAFVSRFGAFCPEGEPVALAAIPARGRTVPALAQGELLDAAARLALGPGADGEALVRAIFEDVTAVAPRIEAEVRPRSQPFSSDRWSLFEG